MFASIEKEISERCLVLDLELSINGEDVVLDGAGDIEGTSKGGTTSNGDSGDVSSVDGSLDGDILLGEGALSASSNAEGDSLGGVVGKGVSRGDLNILTALVLDDSGVNVAGRKDHSFEDSLKSFQKKEPFKMTSIGNIG